MGQKPKTYVELNGRKFDAITGELVVDGPAQPQSKSPKPTDNQVPTQVSDGPPAAKAPQSSRPIGGVTPAEPKLRTTQSKQVHSGPRKGHSLHRGAATQDKDKPPTPAESHDASHDEQPQPARRQLAQNVDKSRLHRSSEQAKSTAISKFSAVQPQQPKKPQDEPPEVPKGEPNTTPAVSPKDELIAKQLAKTAASQPLPKSKKSFKDKVSGKLSNSRSGSVIAASLAALLLIGYITYLNVPRMALRIASGRAGFSAELPGYAPSGFSFSGPVAYSPGELTLQYSSNTDGRYYQIKQQETDWDSQTLQENYVSRETELYSTYQQRGLTVYVLDGSTATWVNGGIWYTIGGDSQLTSEQLLKIVASL